MTGTVYSESIVHSPPAELLGQAPYQLLLVTLSDGRRVMGRGAAGQNLSINDPVTLKESREGVLFFEKSL
jgi:uncharacterized OB-fold protein